MPPRLIQAPRALRRGSLPDPFTSALYACAPYRGCGHGCVYCDGRSERYYVEGDFERDIEARSNLPGLLEGELSRLEDIGAVSLGSGVTDSYQGLEAELCLSSACASVLAQHAWPAVLLTKSDLVLRDIDIWANVARSSSCLVMLTITSLDEALVKVFEPGAPSSARRLAAISRLKAAGCSVGVLAMPLLPLLGDSDEAFSSLAEAALKAGASCIVPGGLTLRPGRQKEYFLEALRSHAPELLPEYLRLYAQERSSGAPLSSYRNERFASAWGQLRDCGIPSLISHAIHRRLLSPPDSLRVLFCHMVELYAQRGIDTAPLRAALLRYDSWLSSLRAQSRRKRRRAAGDDLFGNQEPMQAGLKDIPVGLVSSPLARLAAAEVAAGSLDAVLDNVKLAAFARAVLCEGAVFDYPSLSLG